MIRRPRVILHVDMNAYFASVEQKADPRLKGRPVAVVGDLKRRSIVLTASYEARARGIKTGSLYWEARRLCPGLIAVIADSRKYMAQTAEIIAMLERFSDQVEMVSVDEGYLDVTASLRLRGTNGEGLARLIQTTIQEELGLPCSIGVASNKLLAKLAAGMKKPMGITVIEPEEVAGFMAGLAVSELCGIGPRLSESLRLMGITTCGQLGAAPLEKLEARFGVCGGWMRNWGRGIDDSPVMRVGERHAVKSVGHSTTLPYDVSDRDMIESFLLLLSEKVAARLRRGGFLGRTITATVRTNDFVTVSRGRTVTEHHGEGFEIYRIAAGIVRELKPSRPLRLLGVSVSGLIRAADPGFLFEELARPWRLALATDEVNARFGKGTLKRAKVLEAERFGVLEAPVPPQRHAF